MVWVFRIGLGVAILAYATWLAWPVVDLLSRGVGAPDVWRLAGGASGIPDAAVAAVWIAVILLYGLSGLLTAAGLPWAPGAWFLAFGGEILLRLDLPGPSSPLIDIATRAGEGLQQAGLGLDPAPLTLAALLATGLLILALGAWRGWKGAALTRSWAVLPVWG
jgi:hypothetical protein